MKIELKKLTYSGFRGQSQDLSFSERTLISGRNGSGKSTTMSALLWLISGYDNEDNANNNLFDNKTPNEPEQPKSASVTAVFDIDGTEIKLSKTARQVWKRPRGKEEYERANDQYKYFIDDLEVSATDYANTIEEYFGKGEKLRLMLNADFWSMLSEQTLRKHFLMLAGTINDKEFTQADYTDLYPLLHKETPKGIEDVSVEDLRKTFNNRINDLKKIQTQQEAEIKVMSENLPDISRVGEWEARIATLKAEREQIDAELLGLAHANDEYVAKRKAEENAIFNKEQKLYKAEMEYGNAFANKRRELNTQLQYALANNRNLDSEEARLRRDIEDCESRIKTLGILRQEKLDEVEAILNRTFEPICPNCGANLEGKNRAEALAKFDAKKKADYQVGLTQGQKLRHDWDYEKERLPELQAQLEALQRIDTKPIREAISELESTHIPWYNTETAKNLQSEIETLKANRTEIPPIPDVEQGQIRKGEIDTELSELLGAVAVKKQREKAEGKLEELKAQLKQTISAKAENERMLMLVKTYAKEQSEIIRVRTNKYFDEVEVIMERENKSGGLEPCCKLCVNGVTDTLNTASRTKIGYEVSRAFQKFYGVVLPMFFDRAESLNRENIPNHEGQVVLLKVTETDFGCGELESEEMRINFEMAKRREVFEDELAMRRPG